MQEALDIYIKLLVAIISFIAPLLINLLSIFSEGVAVKTKNFEEFQNNLETLLQDAAKDGKKLSGIATEQSAILKQKTENIQAQLDLLDPKKQIKAIFPVFFYSIIAIMINRLFADAKFCNLLKWDDELLKIIWSTSFMVSIACAISGVNTLYKVTWNVIEVKKEIAEDTAKEKQQTKEEKVTPADDNSKTEIK